MCKIVPQSTEIKSTEHLDLINGVWASPYINRFLQPDSLIPNPANPQGWNRFSYVENRPVYLSDPSGHDGIPAWLESLNPFSFDTWFVSARGAAKFYVGIEGDITLYADISDGLANAKVSVNFESALSLGASWKLRGAIVVGSTKQDIDDISGAKIIGIDGYSGTIAGCHELCFGITPGADKNLKTETKGVLFGFGEGVDVSANLLEISDYIFLGDAKNKKLVLQIPIANKHFFKKLPVIGEYIPE